MQSGVRKGLASLEPGAWRLVAKALGALAVEELLGAFGSSL